MGVRAAEGRQLFHPHDAPADSDAFIELVLLVLRACAD